ncbi:MAG: hypothetical protein VZQ51_07040 [Bacteroidales bacterium]|nr:hypothetical protein [Bacteroidales bacterium]
MKKQLTILSLSALTLFSCGGNQSQTQNVAVKTADTTAKVSTPEPETQTPKKIELSESVMKEIWKQWDLEYKDNAEPEFSFSSVKYKDWSVVCEGELRAYPLDETSLKVYSVYNEYSSDPKDDSDGFYKIEIYVFKDGKLTETDYQPDLTVENGVRADFSVTGDTLTILKNDDSKLQFARDGEKFVKIEIKPGIAEEIFKKEFPKIKEIYSRNPLLASGSEPEESEGCDSGEELACYPLKNGGYLVVFKHDFSGPGCASEYSFWAKKYNDGKLSAVKDVLPVPALEDLLDPGKAADYKKDVDEFRKMFQEAPENYLCYEFQPPESLTVRLHPWECEEAYFNMDKVMKDPYNGDKVPEYKWDCEKFLKK